MKRLLFAAIIIAALTTSAHSSVDTDFLQPTMQVDSTDTVYFDLAHIDLLGNSATFPVYIGTDDIVNSLDFAFKYDMDSIEYDTTIKLATYIDAVFFFNLSFHIIQSATLQC